MTAEQDYGSLRINLLSETIAELTRQADALHQTPEMYAARLLLDVIESRRHRTASCSIFCETHP